MTNTELPSSTKTAIPRKLALEILDVAICQSNSHFTASKASKKNCVQNILQDSLYNIILASFADFKVKIALADRDLEHFEVGSRECIS